MRAEQSTTKPARRQSLSYQISEDEPRYIASCIDPPRGASSEAIAEAMKAQGIKEPEVLLYTNLMTEFRTSSVWSLAAIRENVSNDPDWVDHGPFFICFLKGQSSECAIGTGAPATLKLKDDTNPFDLYEVRVVQASPDGQNPRLLVKTCTEPSGDGSCGIHTTLYAYDKAADRFDTIFNNVTGHNRNQKTRFVESGPMQSDIIVNYPTDDAPYTYWVEVHRQQSDGRYTQILKYRGKTGYNDGNALAVADSEMPEILRRLGKWKQGDPLPVPPKMPGSCASIYLEGTVEWCR